jgi:hypothetical protein
VSIINFCWNPAILTHLCIIHGCFCATWQSWIVSMESIWPAKPKIFTTWPFTENVRDVWSMDTSFDRQLYLLNPLAYYVILVFPCLIYLIKVSVMLNFQTMEILPSSSLYTYPFLFYRYNLYVSKSQGLIYFSVESLLYKNKMLAFLIGYLTLSSVVSY